MNRDSFVENEPAQVQTKPARVSIETLIVEELRRSGFDGPAGYGVPRRKVEAAAQSVLGELTSKPGGVSPEETQALFRYLFTRLGWV